MTHTVLIAMAAAVLCGACAVPAEAQTSSVAITLKTGATTIGTRRRSGGHGKNKSRAAAKPAASPTSPANAATPRLAETGDRLDNAAVLNLTQLGLGDPAIVAKIHASDPHFDVSTNTLIALRQAGVSSPVLAAMIDAQSAASAAELRPDSPDPHAPHPAGVYVLGGWLPEPKMLAMRPVTTTRTTSGSILGYAFSGGLAPVAYRAILPGPHAGVVAGAARPTFFFFTGAATAAQGVVTTWGPAPMPAEVALVRFDITKNGREVRIGSFNIHGASTGVRAQDSIPFSAAEVAPGVTALRPDADLPPGEYGFIQTAAGVGVGAAQVSTSTARVYDFAVGSVGQASHEGALGTMAGAPAGPGVIAGGVAVGGASTARVRRKKVSPFPPLTKAQKEAARLCHYPGGPVVPGCDQP